MEAGRRTAEWIVVHLHSQLSSKNSIIQISLAVCRADSCRGDAGGDIRRY